MPGRPTRDDLVAALVQAREELRRSRRENRNPLRENQVLREAAEPLIHHASARERFTFIRNALRRCGIRQSTSRTGSCLDGAAAESFFATIKAEIGTDRWPDRATARRDIENWIKIYNQRRLHSSLGYRTPDEVRTAWQQRMSNAA